MKTRNPILSVIIPCYNEKDIIATTLETICCYLNEKYPNLEYEILPINDGSNDDTAVIICEASNKFSQIIPKLGYNNNRGRGAAIKFGIACSQGKYVICLDADLSYDVNHIGEILESFNLDPSLDVVVVSPYMPKGTVDGVPIIRRLISRAANWLLSGSLPGKLHTVTCVVRGYRGKLVRQIPFFENSKELHLEMLSKLCVQGASVLEIPGRLHWKNQKQSPRRKTSQKFVSSAKKHLLYGLLLKPTRFFLAVAGFIMCVAIYETIVIMWTTYENFSWNDNLSHSLWLAMSTAYSQSPHTFGIAAVAYVLGFQLLFFLTLCQVLTMQHNENQKMILYFGQRQNRKNNINNEPDCDDDKSL